MGEIVIPYSPRPEQRFLHDQRKRFNVLVCHRRWGKTVWAINEIIKGCFVCPLKRPQFAYLAPQRNQAKRVAWEYVKHYTRVVPGVQYNESELRCDLPNGARIYLLGADDPDALRGIYLDGVILDEVAQMQPKAWSEVIRPALSDREGWAAFIGTPKGQNYFYELYEQAKSSDGWLAAIQSASETNIINPQELAALRKEMSEEEYAQEFECSFTAAMAGVYYGKEMERAEQEGRVTDVPYNPALPVVTSWDLGVGDDTSIIFWQRDGHKRLIIDYYATGGVGLDHYAKVLREKPYSYARHIAPHDIEVRDLSSDGRTRREVAASLGIKFDVAPKLPVDDGINAVRMIINSCWIDKTKCAMLIKSLKNYQRKWDDKMGVFRPTPLHDWSSHAADSMRYYATGEKELSKSFDYKSFYA